MTEWLIIIINVLGTPFVVIIGCMIHYLKYGMATDKVRHFSTLFSRNEETP